MLSRITFGVWDLWLQPGGGGLGIVGRDLDRRRREGIEMSDERSVVLLVGEGTGVCFGESVTIVVLVVVVTCVGVWVELMLTLLMLVLAALVVLCGKLIVFS